MHPVRWSLGKVIKPLVILVGFDGVEPGELRCRRWAHSALYEQTKKPDHVGPPIGCHLEPREPEVLKDLHKEGVQGEPYPKFEVGL